MNQRIKWIDYLKGFLILTVMFGHTLGIPNILKVYIYSFHMPLFFFLSGMLYKKRGCKELLLYINRRLLIPYFFWASGLTVAAYVLTLFAPGMFVQFSGLKQELRNIILGGGPENTIIVSPAIWYLTATIMAILIYTLIERSDYINGMVVICALIGCVLAYKGEMGLYNIVVALIAMPFWHLGVMFGKKKNRLLNYSSYCMLLGGGYKYMY